MDPVKFIVLIIVAFISVCESRYLPEAVDEDQRRAELLRFFDCPALSSSCRTHGSVIPTKSLNGWVFPRENPMVLNAVFKRLDDDDEDLKVKRVMDSAEQSASSADSAQPKPKKKFMSKLRMPDIKKPATVDLDDKFYYEEKGEQVLVTALGLVVVRELGRGAYGVVEEMEHTVTKRHFAVKRIHFSSNDEEQRRMLLELDTCMKSKNCDLMVKFYGAMFRENDVWICMEVMDVSLDKFYRKVTDVGQKVPESFIGKVASSLVDGLNFMKEEMGLIHRDVKPSNILIDRSGRIKICDFGISGQLTNSVAKTMNAGCKPYMPPERIDGEQRNAYGVQADLEIAHGQHPYAKWRTPFEQLKQVVQDAPPTLNKDRGYSTNLHDFITVCLIKDCNMRPKYKDLMQHPFIQWAREQLPVDYIPFIGNVIELKRMNKIFATSFSQEALDQMDDVCI